MHILYIDDDTIASFFFKKVCSVINRNNLVINIAKNGEEALDFIKKTDVMPELLFVDLNMPIMDGWQFLDHFKEINNQQKEKSVAVIVSSTLNPEEIDKAKEYNNVVKFISKPITTELVEDLLNKYCKASNA